MITNAYVFFRELHKTLHLTITVITTYYATYKNTATTVQNELLSYCTTITKPTTTRQPVKCIA